jgi:FkbM family methyltransferase
MYTAFIVLVKMYGKKWFNKGVRKSYSQNAEDLLIEKLVKKVSNGVYVDVGAYHPMTYSNTYALYQKGWSGYVVEPNEGLHMLYKYIRPRDTLIATGVSDIPTEATYYAFTNGAYNTFDPEVAKKLEQSEVGTARTMSVHLVTLDGLVTQYGIGVIDLLSIDVEGLDERIISAYSFAVRPRVIAIEDHALHLDSPATSAIYSCLHTQGYMLVGHTAYTSLYTDTRHPDLRS